MIHITISVLYIARNLALTVLATWAQQRFAGEHVIELTPVGAAAGGGTSGF